MPKKPAKKMTTKALPHLPSIDEVQAEYELKLARLRRLNLKLSADVTVLEEELAVKVRSLNEYVRKNFVANTEATGYREAAKAATEDWRGLRAKLDTAADRVKDLERENGQLEARLARLTGRVVVVAKEDEVAMLVSTLVQVRDMIGEPPAQDAFGKSFREWIPTNMVEGKLRGAYGLAARAVKAVAEERKLNKDEVRKHSVAYTPGSTAEASTTANGREFPQAD